MKFINENYEIITNIDQTEYFWLFDFYETKKRAIDFHLEEQTIAYQGIGDAYILKIGNDLVHIPSTFYVLIGDYDGGLDNIIPEEIAGREFEVFVFDITLEAESWRLEPAEVVGFVEDYEYHLPSTKLPYPIAISGERAILVSERDIYSKLKNLTFQDII